MSLTRQELAERAASLAVQGVYVGTSSWKYPGWCGMIYDRARYEYRGKFAETRFKRDCLAEYAEVFKTVCVDAAYYTFPSQQYLEGMVNQAPEDFLFGLKVTDSITIKKYPKLDRFGDQAGKPNENFLNAELFVKAFLKPCEAVRANIGLLMFEFSRFWPHDYEHGRDFIADLDKFFGQLPKGWPYGVEMRNRNWLKPEYFDCLARHKVAHVYNSWDAMPPVGEQMALPGSRTNPDLIAARFLLKPGRKYEQAVKAFEPYDSIKEENREARLAGRALIAEGKATAGLGELPHVPIVGYLLPFWFVGAARRVARVLGERTGFTAQTRLAVPLNSRRSNVRAAYTGRWPSGGSPKPSHDFSGARQCSVAL